MILCLLMNLNYFPKALSELNLLENSPNNNTLPHHFRKSSNYKSIIKDDNINLKGVAQLYISGSAQFSDAGVSLIKDAIDKN
ncbi:phosphatase, partial [Clostridium sp. HCS.1]